MPAVDSPSPVAAIPSIEHSYSSMLESAEAPTSHQDEGIWTRVGPSYDQISTAAGSEGNDDEIDVQVDPPTSPLFLKRSIITDSDEIALIDSWKEWFLARKEGKENESPSPSPPPVEGCNIVGYDGVVLEIAQTSTTVPPGPYNMVYEFVIKPDAGEIYELKLKSQPWWKALQLIAIKGWDDLFKLHRVEWRDELNDDAQDIFSEMDEFRAAASRRCIHSREWSNNVNRDRYFRLQPYRDEDFLAMLALRYPVNAPVAPVAPEPMTSKSLKCELSWKKINIEESFTLVTTKQYFDACLPMDAEGGRHRRPIPATWVRGRDRRLYDTTRRRRRPLSSSKIKKNVVEKEKAKTKQIMEASEKNQVPSIVGIDKDHGGMGCTAREGPNEEPRPKNGNKDRESTPTRSSEDSRTPGAKAQNSRKHKRSDEDRDSGYVTSHQTSPEPKRAQKRRAMHVKETFKTPALPMKSKAKSARAIALIKSGCFEAGKRSGESGCGEGEENVLSETLAGSVPARKDKSVAPPKSNFETGSQVEKVQDKGKKGILGSAKRVSKISVKRK